MVYASIWFLKKNRVNFTKKCNAKVGKWNLHMLLKKQSLWLADNLKIFYTQMTWLTVEEDNCCFMSSGRVPAMHRTSMSDSVVVWSSQCTQKSYNNQQLKLNVSIL